MIYQDDLHTHHVSLTKGNKVIHHPKHQQTWKNGSPTVHAYIEDHSFHPQTSGFATLSVALSCRARLLGEEVISTHPRSLHPHPHRLPLHHFAFIRPSPTRQKTSVLFAAYTAVGRARPSPSEYCSEQGYANIPSVGGVN